jgi:hypothetical protein
VIIVYRTSIFFEVSVCAILFGRLANELADIVSYKLFPASCLKHFTRMEFNQNNNQA